MCLNSDKILGVFSAVLGWILLFQGCYFSDVPDIQKFTFQDDIQDGKLVSVTCLAVSKTKPLKFSWTKNGENIDSSNNNNIKVEESSQFSVLIIESVTLQSEGNYTCTARNSYGSNSYTAMLKVKASPKWAKLPEDVIATRGNTVIIHCEASGSPLPTITWKKIIDLNRHEVITAMDLTNSSRKTSAQGVLKFSPISAENEGFYECSANNGIQPIIRSNFSIVIRVPARFEEKFDVVKAKKGDSARMKCEAQGDQPLSITWHREQTVVSKNDDNRYEIFETMEPKGVVSELIIRTTDREDGALYSCLAENEYGHDERKIRLLVMEVPAPPTDAKIREIWSKSSSVSWAPPYSGNSPITQYIVQYWRDVDGASHRLHELSAPSSQVSALLKDLLPGAGYVLKIVAENSVGRGEPSDAISFRTGEEEPGASPTDINADPRGSSTIRVSWKPPPKDSWNGELKGYYVGYKTRDSSHPYSYKTTDYVPDSQQEFFLSNLLKASDYSIAVKAYNSAGSGPPSHEMYVRTLDGDLPPAPSLYVLATSHSSVTLTWNTRKIDNILSGYTVHFREEQGQWQEVAVIAPEDNTYTLGNLLPSRLYQIYVTATNKYGKGDPSEIVAIKTDERDGHSLLSVSNFGGPGSYVDMAILIPVTASLLTICVVLIVACVCMRKIRSRHNLERALAAEKHLAMVGTLQRYVDIDKTRSLLDPNIPGLFPAPYETIPMSEEHHAQAKAMAQEVIQACYPKDGTQTLSNKPITLAKKDENIYDMPQ